MSAVQKLWPVAYHTTRLYMLFVMVHLVFSIGANDLKALY